MEKEPFCRGGFAAWFGHLSRWLYAALLPLVLPTFRGRIQALFSSRLGISLAVFSDLFYFPATRILTWYQSPGKEIRADKARSRQGRQSGGILQIFPHILQKEAFCKIFHKFCKKSLVTRTLVVAPYSKKASPSLTSSRIGSAPVFPRAYLSLFSKAVVLVLLEQSSTQICGI